MFLLFLLHHLLFQFLLLPSPLFFFSFPSCSFQFFCYFLLISREKIHSVVANVLDYLIFVSEHKPSYHPPFYSFPVFAYFHSSFIFSLISLFSVYFFSPTFCLLFYFFSLFFTFSVFALISLFSFSMLLLLL